MEEDLWEEAASRRSEGRGQGGFDWRRTKITFPTFISGNRRGNDNLKKENEVNAGKGI